MYRYKEANLFRRIMRKSGTLPGMWWIYSHTLHHLDHALYRASKGRSTLTSWLTGLPVVQLTTTGARTGIQRTIPLVAIPHEDALVIIASNFGQPRHPAWYYNLKANPRATISFQGRTSEMVALELEGKERDHWYRRGIEIYPGWVDYRRRTSHHRVIPVIELIPVDKGR